MALGKSSNLEDVLSKGNPNNEDGDTKLRLVLLSELELATKLSDPAVLSNVGELIKNYEGRLDGVVINGGLAFIPDKYSRLKGERLDLVEDHLKEIYGNSIYKQVKRGKNDSDSVDDLVEAARLARVQMKSLAYETKKKGIPILYVYGTTDYKNVKMIIEALEKLSRKNERNAERKQKNNKNGDLDEEEIPDEAELLMSVVPEDYKFKASQWKSVDKEGIKNKANEIYKHLLGTIFGTDNLRVYKRFENFMGNKSSESDADAEILINGLKVKIFHAINGLASGLNEGKPTDRNLKMTVDYANADPVDRRADLYITGRGSSTEFTAVNFQSRDNPVFVFNQGPLLDIDKQFKLRASFNKTDISKRLSQFEDSGLSIFAIKADGVVEIEHLDATAIKKKIIPNALEKELSKGSMYEMTTLSDWHIGSAYADYVATEGVSGIMSRSEVPREKRSVFNGGDMVDGGNDKAQRTRMSLPKAITPEELLKVLETLSVEKNSKKRTQGLIDALYDSIYLHSDIDIGRQLKRLEQYIAPIAGLVHAVYAVNGNHFEKATGNGSEADATGMYYKSHGTDEVIYPDFIQERGQNPMLGNYTLLQFHSPGYRGGADARTSLMNIVKNTGQDLVDIVMAGDCHEAGIKFAFKRKGDEWRTLVAVTAPSLQKQTDFEKNILHKPDYTKGASQLYLPTDDSIGTSYVKYRLIPSQTIRAEVYKRGGPAFKKLLNQLIEK
jgi:hypothetical protein